MLNNSKIVPTSIHPLTTGELDAVDEVIMVAYGLTRSRKQTLRRYLALQPDGAFVAEQGGVVVGFGGVKNYGSFAYIGLMSVHPAAQNQGIGRLLLEHILNWLGTCGYPTVLLDATPVGVSLYKHYNFVEDDKTLVLQQSQQAPYGLAKASSNNRIPPFAGSVSVLNGEELPALFAFDAPFFGGERATVLASYWTDDPERVLVTYNRERQITGYLIAQDNILGPWVARNVEDAERLLVRALALPFKGGPGIFVSAHNNEALRLFDRYGFREQRALSHMRRGNKVQRSRHSTLYGQASLGLG